MRADFFPVPLSYLSPGSRRVQRTSGRPQASANAAEGPGDVKARAPARDRVCARRGLDIAWARPTLDMAFEGANRDFERFPSISATPTPKPLHHRSEHAGMLGQITEWRWQPSTRDTVSTGMGRKSLILHDLLFG